MEFLFVMSEEYDCSILTVQNTGVKLRSTNWWLVFEPFQANNHLTPSLSPSPPPSNPCDGFFFSSFLATFVLAFVTRGRPSFESKSPLLPFRKLQRIVHAGSIVKGPEKSVCNS
ncbi:hypothetical protein K1719_015624 [Acacia pycnantha]|nr:hypothetical protein K1719_015624 [Acacia pycnantha]